MSNATAEKMQSYYPASYVKPGNLPSESFHRTCSSPSFCVNHNSTPLPGGTDEIPHHVRFFLAIAEYQRSKKENWRQAG